MMNLFEPIGNKVIIRIPNQPYHRVKDLSEEELRKAIENNFFLEALWLASPALYVEAQKWKEGRLDAKAANKVLISLSKYYQRLSTRPTPFGLFASCSVTAIQDESADFVFDTFQLGRKSRFDMDFVCDLIHKIESDPAMRPFLKFKVNESLYRIDSSYRLVECIYHEKKRIHNLIKVEYDQYLEMIISFCKNVYRSEAEIVTLLVNNQITSEDAMAFAADLIQTGVLQSNLQPSVLSPDSFSDLIQQLDACRPQNFNNLLQFLKRLQRKMTLLDKQSFGITKYQEIIKELQGTTFNFDPSKLFQVDSYYVFDQEVGVDRATINSLLEIVGYLKYFSTNTPSLHLKTFKEKFIERYEYDNILLTKLLDPDVGLGYPVDSPYGSTPLVDDFEISEKGVTRQITVSGMEDVLCKLLLKCKNENIKAIELTKEFPDLGKTNVLVEEDNLQASLSLGFKTYKINGKNKIHFEFLGGISAIDLIGRFAHVHQSVRDLIDEIAIKEKEVYSDSIIADLVHLPESRAGNVSSHPPIYPYHIAFLSNSSSESELLSLEDLFVRIDENGKICLWSKSKDKRVIPRLSNAHNFRFKSSLPIYRFLCEMQNESRYRSVSFQWGGLMDFFDFFPRVECKSIIVSLATWKIQTRELDKIIKCLKDGHLDDAVLGLREWRIEKGMPNTVVLSKVDNELLLNFDNRLSSLTFLNEIKKLREFQLVEFIPPNDQIEEGHVRQFILPLGRTTSLDSKASPPSIGNLKRKFLPGSKVASFKIYGGFQFLEKVFINDIYPVLTMLEQNGIISKWFFIRFNDPNFHFRVRLFLKDECYFGEVAQVIYQLLDPYVKGNLLSKIVLDTYNREIERYFNPGIENWENLFYFDSVATARILKKLIQMENEQLRWIYALLSIDKFLEAFDYSVHSRHELMQKLRKSFFIEFGGSKGLNVKLSEKYRHDRVHIQEALLLMNHAEVNGILNDRALAIRQERLSTSKWGTLESGVHMLINRFFLSEPRKHELVLYDYLDRHYTSFLKRKSI